MSSSTDPPSASSSDNFLSGIITRLSVVNMSSPAVAAPSSMSPCHQAKGVSLIGKSLLFFWEGGGLDNVNSKGIPIVSISDKMKSSLCGGHIGVSRNKFCLKLKDKCSIHVSGGSHATSKFEAEKGRMS